MNYQNICTAHDSAQVAYSGGECPLCRAVSLRMGAVAQAEYFLEQRERVLDAINHLSQTIKYNPEGVEDARLSAMEVWAGIQFPGDSL